MILLILFTLIFKISKVNLKKKIIIILSVFIIPFILHLNIGKITVTISSIFENAEQDKTIFNQEIEVKDFNEDIKVKEKKIEKIPKIKEEKNKEIINNLKQQRILLQNSTGRIELWNKTISLFFENNLKGYGPQADRELLNQNVSNLYFYAMLCGGIISLVAIILLSIILFYKSIQMTFIKKIFSSTQTLTCFSLLIIGFLYLRTIAENSFGLFGIDMIIFFISFNILRNSENY